jgi:transposase
MEVLHSRCAGLDVHRDTVVGCARIAADGAVAQDVRTFGATTKELMALSEWLTEHGVTHVAMEATGVYWKPVWHVLEGSFELVLANAMHIKNVPGRKTDVNDATWIADLLAHGLIRGSFVPPAPVQDLRALTRTRKQLVRERASHVQRVDKILQDANLKLGSVITDIISEIGVDMSRFQTSAHIISWAGFCPKNDESAGKRRSTRLRKGAPWLKTLLVQCARCAARTKNTYLQAQFLRLKARRGPKKAIMAVAASILTAIYHMLKNGVDYRDLGADHFSRNDKTKSVNRLLRKIESFGFEVTGIREKQAA